MPPIGMRTGATWRGDQATPALRNGPAGPSQSPAEANAMSCTWGGATLCWMRGRGWLASEQPCRRKGGGNDPSPLLALVKLRLVAVLSLGLPSTRKALRSSRGQCSKELALFSLRSGELRGELPAALLVQMETQPSSSERGKQGTSWELRNANQILKNTGFTVRVV